MGISNVNYFTIEADFIQETVHGTSTIPIYEYVGQQVDLFFGLNGDSLPDGQLGTAGNGNGKRVGGACTSHSM